MLSFMLRFSLIGLSSATFNENYGPNCVIEGSYLPEN